MLSLQRRHTRTCPIRPKGGKVLNKCACPLWAIGTVESGRVRQSLDTINLEIGAKKLRALEGDLVEGKIRKPIADAVKAFMGAKRLSPRSAVKYQRSLDAFARFAVSNGAATLDRFTLEHLDAFRDTRTQLSALSWSKELTLLRTFFKFAVRRKWCELNVAKEMDMPPNPKPKPREPYTSDEIVRIFAAAETIGQQPYERQRARAMLLLMNFYALRVSDVATFRRDRINGDQIALNSFKNGEPLWFPLYPEVKEALEALPLPDGASADCPYFFWTGHGSVDSLFRAVERTLTSVFRRSQVPKACAHRFRHTLVTRILVNGGTDEDAANILGDSPAVIRKHYAKWSPDYQHRTVELMRKVHKGLPGTPLTHEKKQGGNPAFSEENLEDRVVAREGFEPPTRGFSVRCSTN
jgi:site-specific recombinase XerD